VFFRAQTQLTGELHKELIYRLGQLTTRPKENGLWKHPLYQYLGEKDPELNPLDTSRQRSMYGKEVEGDKVQSARMAWHSDVAFEPNPPDYSSLRMTELPKAGGGAQLLNFIQNESEVADCEERSVCLHDAQIPCGLLATKFTTVSLGRFNACWRV